MTKRLFITSFPNSRAAIRPVAERFVGLSILVWAVQFHHRVISSYHKFITHWLLLHIGSHHPYFLNSIELISNIVGSLCGWLVAMLSCTWGTSPLMQCCYLCRYNWQMKNSWLITMDRNIPRRNLQAHQTHNNHCWLWCRSIDSALAYLRIFSPLHACTTTSILLDNVCISSCFRQEPW